MQVGVQGTASVGVGVMAELGLGMVSMPVTWASAVMTGLLFFTLILARR